MTLNAGRGARVLLLSLSFVLLLAAACSTTATNNGRDESSAPLPVASEQAAGGTAPAPAAEPAQPMPAAAAGLGSSPVESAQVVGQAYRELITRLFREVRPGDLLAAGWKGVRDDARRQGGIAAEQLQPFIDAGSGDIDAFMREFTLFLNGPGAGLEAGRLAQAAVRSMAASVGDSHTRYLPPERAQLQDRSDGTYSGIGVETRQDGGPGLTIREVYGGSPAEQAGLRKGERIVRVNGAELGGRAQAEISAQIRGETGTSVNLTVLDAAGVRREVTVSRARILPPVIGSRMLEDGIGYLKVSQFPRKSVVRDAAADFDAALSALQAQGARAFVLDLRGNPGGDPFTSVDIASNFVQDGPIFVAIDRNGRRTVYPANKNRRLVGAPVVALIDGGSASGAEVVASALSEYGAAYLIGTATCGCLSVGQPMRLDDKSEIVVTVQQALTGKLGRSLEGRGLDPDEFVRNGRVTDPDVQLGRALEYLREKLP